MRRWAYEYSRAEMIKVLLSAGADANAKARSPLVIIIIIIIIIIVVVVYWWYWWW